MGMQQGQQPSMAGKLTQPGISQAMATANNPNSLSPYSMLTAGKNGSQGQGQGQGQANQSGQVPAAPSAPSAMIPSVGFPALIPSIGFPAFPQMPNTQGWQGGLYGGSSPNVGGYAPGVSEISNPGMGAYSGMAQGSGQGSPKTPS